MLCTLIHTFMVYVWSRLILWVAPTCKWGLPGCLLHPVHSRLVLARAKATLPQRLQVRQTRYMTSKVSGMGVALLRSPGSSFELSLESI